MASADVLKARDFRAGPPGFGTYALSDSVSTRIVGSAGNASTTDLDSLSPGWAGPVLTDVEALLALGADWNGYGAPKVDRAALGEALQILWSSATAATPPPSLVPTGVGGVQLEWHSHGFDIEVYFHPREVGAGLFVQDHREGTEIETRLLDDVTSLAQALDQLTRRQAREAEGR